MRKRGVVTIVFDDGYEAVYDNVLPLLRQFNLPAVFAISLHGQKLAKTEQRRVKPWPEWLTLKTAGHEIASHSVTHPNLTLLNDEDLKQELSLSQNKLSSSTIVYPGGAHDNRVVTCAAQYYRAGRTVHYGFEKIPPRDPMRLKSYNFSKNNFSVRKANYLAFWAYLNNLWLIETYHLVDEKETAIVHSVPTSALKRHLQFISHLPISVKTINSVIS